jgi:hypothetical protein
VRKPKFSLETIGSPRRFRLHHFAFSRTRRSQLTRWIFYFPEGRAQECRALALLEFLFYCARTRRVFLGAHRPPAAVHYRILCAELRFMLLCATIECYSLSPAPLSMPANLVECVSIRCIDLCPFVTLNIKTDVDE